MTTIPANSLTKPRSHVMQKISNLKRVMGETVLLDLPALKPYSKDESIFEIQPQAVVVPQTTQGFVKTIQFLLKKDLPFTVRGGGSGVAGQSIGEGVIVSTEKLNRILEVGKDFVWVEPGVVLEKLNEKLKSIGQKIGPDPGSAKRATLGGMVSTNASGPRYLKYGSMRDHVLELEVILENGKTISTKDFGSRFLELEKKVRSNAFLIESHCPKVLKNSSGYALKELLDPHPRYERFLVGSEGTLCAVKHIKLKTVEFTKSTVLALISFDSIEAALEEVPEILLTHPTAVELIDKSILQLLLKSKKNVEASLWVEWDEKPQVPFKGVVTFVENQDQQTQMWHLRSQSSKLLHETYQNKKPLRCIEDCAVPIHKLKPFVVELKKILNKHDCMGPIFGHVGSGHVHVNPLIPVFEPYVAQKIYELMTEVYALVMSLGGSISGEHGDGLLRAEFNSKMWGPLYHLMEKVKQTFDPKNVFNPGKKISNTKWHDVPLRDFKKNWD